MSLKESCKEKRLNLWTNCLVIKGKNMGIFNETGKAQNFDKFRL